MSDVSILSVAEYVLSQSEGKKQNKAQLNTICYFIQEQYISITNEPLFRDQFVKKGHYPECAVLNGAFSGAENKSCLEAADLKEFRRKFSCRTREIMDFVLSENKNITSKDILLKMKGDSPWCETEEGRVITNKKMSRKYINQDIAEAKE
jgi:uncharacterized phage-associated protein